MKLSLRKPLLLISMFLASSCLFGCGSKEKVDYVHNGSVKLTLDYKNHDFFKDGIGQVTVKTYIDGDTTHFNNVYGDKTTTLKARYYGIDTPESTGNIQPYGKQASNFTHDKLANAAANGTIVVSSPFSVSETGGAGSYGKPETDSTGSRYLSLVWINETVKNAPVESLVLFNLWIVQEGLSWAKNTSEVPAFQDTFSKAQKQAEEFKLKLWSGEPDPLYNYGDYQSISLLDVKHETELFLEDPEYVNKYSGANVRFTGVVSGYCNHNLYVQEFYPEDPDKPEGPGEWAGINIFCGMTAISPIYTTVGTYLQVVGKASNSETFGFQIGDTQGHFPPSPSTDESDVQILLSAEDNKGIHSIKTFEYTAEQQNDNIANSNFANLFCRTKITDSLVCTNAYVNDDGDEVTLSFEGCDFTAYLPFTYHGNPDDAGDTWMTPDKFLGKSFSLSGVFAYHKTQSGRITYQLVVCGDSDLVCQTRSKGTTTANPFTVNEAVTDAPNAIENVTYYVDGKIGEILTSTSTEVLSQEAVDISFSDAVDLVEALPAGDVTAAVYRVKGVVGQVTESYSSQYKNVTFMLKSEDENETRQIQAFRIKAQDGVIISNLKERSKVTIEGKLHNYVKGGVSSPEFADDSLIVAHTPLGSISFTMVELDKTIYVENASIPTSILEGKYDSEAQRIKAINDYIATLVPGTTVHLKGIPEVKQDKVYYTGATIVSSYPHGQRIEDPLNVVEAYTIASSLEPCDPKVSDKKSAYYYIEGTISEITVPYSTEDKRLSFVLSDGVNTFLVSKSKIASDIPVQSIVVGATVVVGANLINYTGFDPSGCTTYYNGCKIQIIR